MIFRLARHLLLAFLIVGTAHAAPNPRPFNRATAMKAPVSVLARAALTAAAPQFVEVERPDWTGLGGPGAPLHAIRFATAPEMAGYPGLCKATTTWVDISSGSPPMGTATVYKIVGDLAPLPGVWNKTYEATLKQKCARAGRVLRRKSSDFGQVTFFGVSKGSEDRVWQTSRALQLAIAQAKFGSAVTCVPQPGIDPQDLKDMAATDPEVVEDRENHEGCAQPAATLANLKLERVLQMDVDRCPAVKENIYCMSASFLRRADFNHQSLWQVTMRYEEGTGDNPDIASISALALHPSFAVYD